MAIDKAERVLLQMSTSRDLSRCGLVPPKSDEPKSGRSRKNGRRVIADASRVELGEFLSVLEDNDFVFVGGHSSVRVGCNNLVWTLEFYRKEIAKDFGKELPAELRQMLTEGVFNQGQMFENPAEPDKGRGPIDCFICTEGVRPSAATLEKFPDRKPRSLTIDEDGEYCVLDEEGNDFTDRGGTSISTGGSAHDGLRVKLGDVVKSK